MAGRLSSRNGCCVKRRCGIIRPSERQAVRHLLIAAAVASATLTAMPPVMAFPFQLNVNSITYWLNTLRLSKDPTFKKRIHSLYNCRHAFDGETLASLELAIRENGGSGKPGNVLQCDGYIDIVDGTYPNGTRCEMTANIDYDSATAIEEVNIKFENKYCYKGKANLLWE